MKTAYLTAAILTFLPALAIGDVVDSGANGFTLKTAVQIQAPPAEVYRKIVFNVGDWWSPQHTFSGNSHNLTMEAKAQGCFCEKLPNEGSVRHMEVLAALPGEKLVLSGAMGPLQALAVTGSMTWQLSAAEGGTKLELTYAAAGYLATGLTTWAKIVDIVLAEQVTRLKNFIEHGSPGAK
jgi:uncharacterized protein YndB with AHSA1/START domain